MLAGTWLSQHVTLFGHPQQSSRFLFEERLPDNLSPRYGGMGYGDSGDGRSVLSGFVLARGCGEVYI